MSRRVSSMPLPSGSLTSTSATSGSECARRSIADATLPAAATTSWPDWASRTSSPPRMASWSSITTSLVTRAKHRDSGKWFCRKERLTDNQSPEEHARTDLWFVAHGEGHREAHQAAVAHLVPDGGAQAGHRAG